MTTKTQPVSSIRAIVKMEAGGCTRSEIASFLEDYIVYFDGSRLWVSDVIGENGDGWYFIGLTENDNMGAATLEGLALTIGKTFNRETKEVCA